MYHGPCKICNDIGAVIYQIVSSGIPRDYGARCPCKKGEERYKAWPTMEQVGLVFHPGGFQKKEQEQEEELF